MSSGPIVCSYLVPGLPQPLLCPEKNKGWMRVRESFGEVAQEIKNTPEVDCLLLYTNTWVSLVGHQIQGAFLEGVHVDRQFHDLGEISYSFPVERDLARSYHAHCQKRGLPSRIVDYKNFPMDTGSVVALKLMGLNIPVLVVSPNAYAQREETMALGQAAVDTLKILKKRAIAVVVSSLSNRMHQTFIEPSEDKIHSLKDEEWNKKILEFLSRGKLKELEGLSSQIQEQARVGAASGFKSLWWLYSLMRSRGHCRGKVFAYEPIYGTGAAVVSLRPLENARGPHG